MFFLLIGDERTAAVEVPTSHIRYETPNDYSQNLCASVSFDSIINTTSESPKQEQVELIE